MNTLTQRGNSVFAFAVTVASCIAFANFFVSSIMWHLPSLQEALQQNVKLSVKSVNVKNDKMPSYFIDNYFHNYYYPREYYGEIKFDLTADLRPLFNWNTKQLFVYLVAEYESDTHGTNQVFLWDTIIENKDDALLDMHDYRNTYGLTDIRNKLKTVKKAKLRLQWDLTPHVGRVFGGSGGKDVLITWQ